MTHQFASPVAFWTLANGTIACASRIPDGLVPGNPGVDGVRLEEVEILHAGGDVGETVGVVVSRPARREVACARLGACASE